MNEPALIEKSAFFIEEFTMYKFVVRLNGTEAAFSPLFRNRTRRPKVCTSVSFFIFRDRHRVHHSLLDIGPGVNEAIQTQDQYPEPFPLDWVILSHSHMDHILGLDVLCGDYHWWAKVNSREPARLKVHCFEETFEETVNTHFRFQQKMIDHSPATPGKDEVLWTDGQAEFRVTLLEVKHFRRSAVSLFSFSDGTEEPVRVVCLFDFDDFFPPNSPQAQAGGHANNPLFHKPDLLIAEATAWTNQKHTIGKDGTHLSFEQLADYISLWSPLQTRVVHYAGFEDMVGSDGPQEYRRKVEQGLHLHPSEGPVSPWEMTAAMQEFLHKKGWPRPRSVTLGHQGETLVVYPRVEFP